MPSLSPNDRVHPSPKPGTAVIRRAGGLRGVVQRYEQYACSVGTFPVRWRFTGIWEVVDIRDVIVVADTVSETNAA